MVDHRSYARGRVALGAAVALVAALSLAACKAPTPPVEPATTTPAPAAAAPTPATAPQQGQPEMSSVHDALKKDMAYADLRKLAVDGGWQPVVDPECRTQVVGHDEQTCKENPDLAICRACTDIPELSAYSGDGYAKTRFSHSGEQLEVISYGMIEDWNVAGENSRLRVTEWSFKK
ncbi:MAG: hypothetical protein ACREP7_02935 [Lysobacter sp.]